MSGPGQQQKAGDVNTIQSGAVLGNGPTIPGQPPQQPPMGAGGQQGKFPQQSQQYTPNNFIMPSIAGSPMLQSSYSQAPSVVQGAFSPPAMAQFGDFYGQGFDPTSPFNLMGNFQSPTQGPGNVPTTSPIPGVGPGNIPTTFPIPGTGSPQPQPPPAQGPAPVGPAPAGPTAEPPEPFMPGFNLPGAYWNGFQWVGGAPVSGGGD